MNYELFEEAIISLLLKGKMGYIDPVFFQNKTNQSIVVKILNEGKEINSLAFNTNETEKISKIIGTDYSFLGDASKVVRGLRKAFYINKFFNDFLVLKDNVLKAQDETEEYETIDGFINEQRESLISFFEPTEGVLAERCVPSELMKEFEDARVPTGLPSLDRLLSGGLSPLETVIIAGRPSTGKTAFILSVIEHITSEHETEVLFFSLDMNSKVLMLRVVTLLTKMNIRNANREEIDRVFKEQIKKRKLKLEVLENANLGEMVKRIKKLKQSDKRVKLVVIDYVQLVHTKQTKYSRTDEIGFILKTIKSVCCEVGAVLVLLSQLSRVGDSDSPSLSSLRSSGSLEQDSDVIILLSKYGVSEESAFLKVAKNRNGQTGGFVLNFTKRLFKFEENTERREDFNVRGKERL